MGWKTIVGIILVGVVLRKVWKLRYDAISDIVGIKFDEVFSMSKANEVFS